VTDGDPAGSGLKKNWTPTPEAFHQLLSWLDEGVDSGGAAYVEMRRRLVAYFARKACLTPDELADETLNRAARRLHEEGTIADAPAARYCYILARFVFLESLRHPEHRPPARSSLDFPAPSLTASSRDKQLDCLDRCLAQIPDADRELILEYYRGDQRQKIDHRRALAARLGMSPNALSIRACRIRARLETCVSACSAEDEMFSVPLSHQE
jgi:DNA-directed RNA polymerase specialized sigma24 family protein